MAQDLPISASIRRYTASTTLATFIDYLHGTYFAGVSTLFEVDSGVTRTAGDSLCIKPIGGTWQINFRRTSTTVMQIRIAPTGGITNAGTSGADLTGGSYVSGVLSNFLWSTSTAGALIFEKGNDETDARLWILVEAAASANYVSAQSMGRIYAPFLPDGNAQGVTGFGCHGGAATNALNESEFHTTGQIQYGTGHATATNNWGTVYGNGALQLTSDLAGSSYAPTPVAAVTYPTYRAVGLMRDVFLTATARTGITRIQDNSNTEGYLHVGSTSGTVITPWNPAVNPLSP